MKFLLIWTERLKVFRQKGKLNLVPHHSHRFDRWIVCAVCVDSPQNSQCTNCTNVSCELARNGRTDSCVWEFSSWPNSKLTSSSLFCVFPPVSLFFPPSVVSVWLWSLYKNPGFVILKFSYHIWTGKEKYQSTPGPISITCAPKEPTFFIEHEKCVWNLNINSKLRPGLKSCCGFQRWPRWNIWG